APRWALSAAAAWYPPLRAAGVPLSRSHELRLVHRILRHSQLVAEAEALRGATDWDTPLDPHEPQREAGATLFELEATAPHPGAVPAGLEETLAEFARQRAAIDAAGDPARLRLLVAAASTCALLDAELHVSVFT